MSTLFDLYDALDADNLIVVDYENCKYGAVLNSYNIATNGAKYEIAMRKLFRKIPVTWMNGREVTIDTANIANKHIEQLRDLFYVDGKEYTDKDVIRDFARWVINVCNGFSTEEYINKVLEIIGDEKA